MALYEWNNAPAGMRTQVDQLTSTLSRILADNLVGIYLHGSLALGSFNPDASDLDLLVMTDHSIGLETKRRIAEQLLQRSMQPRPIEFSFLRRADLRPWRYPTPFDLHYSEMWRADYERALATGAWRSWNDTQRYDPDLAAHITIVNHRGICLAGAPIPRVFPAVPRHDYLASVMEDVTSALDDIAGQPVYAILNACRTSAYLSDGHIFSKAEGGEWALRVLPLEWRPPVEKALAAYCGERSGANMDSAMLEGFANYMRAVLQGA